MDCMERPSLTFHPVFTTSYSTTIVQFQNQGSDVCVHSSLPFILSHVYLHLYQDTELLHQHKGLPCALSLESHPPPPTQHT